MKDVTQKELMEEFGFTSTQFKKLRDKHLTASDWYRQDEFPRGICYTLEGEKRLRLHIEEPRITPWFEDMFCREQCKNKAWVRCRTKDRTMVNVIIPPKLANRLVGKPIRVECIQNDTGISYRHESLSR